MENAAWMCRESYRREAFRLLSECYQLPGPDLDSKLKALERHMARACPSAVPCVSEMRAYFEAGGDVESLQVEFSRLFIGPFGAPAPPYGSVYLDGDGSFMGNSAMDVLDRYKQEGLDISDNFHDAPDHITAELEFVYFLNSKALEAAENGDREAPSRYLEKRRHFLTEHLNAWTPDFERQIEENANAGYFKKLIRATRLLIQTDIEVLSGCHSTPESREAPAPIRRQP